MDFLRVDHQVFWQVDWENLVGVMASVSITGAFRFSGVGNSIKADFGLAI